MPFGGATTRTLPGTPDPSAAHRETLRMRRLFAVRLTTGPDGVECLLFATGRLGPLRQPLSLPAALALAASGLHTVVIDDRSSIDHCRRPVTDVD